MSNINGPCLNCKERKPLCHSTCEKYIKFRNERDKFLELRHKCIYDVYFKPKKGGKMY